MMRAFIFVFLVLYSGNAFAWDKTRNGDDLTHRLFSPVDYKAVDVEAAKEGYSFVVLGTLTGKGSVPDEPAEAILKNIELIKDHKPFFIAALGDMIWGANPEQESIDFKRRVMAPVALPFFVTPGNHDLIDGKIYEKHFGATYYAFVLNSEMFIFLNSGGWTASCEITDDQFKFLTKQLKKAHETVAIKNVLVFSHQLVWAEAYRTGDHKKDVYLGIAQTDTCRENNFTFAVYPYLLSAEKPIYWFSGEVAGAGVGRPLYHYDKRGRISYIATALTDEESDHMLEVAVSKDGEIDIRVVPFYAKTALPIESYTFDFWLAEYEFGKN